MKCSCTYLSQHTGKDLFRGDTTKFLQTLVGRPDLKQYMNVATGQGLLAVNSANMWFPVGAGQSYHNLPSA